MKTYTIRVEAIYRETAAVAVRALERWFSGGVGFQDAWVHHFYPTACLNFPSSSDTDAAFTATFALRECGLAEFPAELREGTRVIATQKGSTL